MSEQQPTYDQIDEQLAAAQPASVLVERDNDKIAVGQVVARGEDRTSVYFTNLNQESNGEAIPTKVVPIEKLSDEHQQELAVALAGHALREGKAAPAMSGWNQWKQDHPLSPEQTAAIRESVNKNMDLTQKYGSAYFNAPKDK